MILSKLKNYYHFRIKQLFRIANNNLESFFIYIIFGLIIYFYDLKTDWLFLIYYIIPPLYFHSNRKDILFIKQIFTNKQYLILLSEYLIVYLVIFVLTFNKNINILIPFFGLIFCFIYPLIYINKTEWTKKINLSYLPIETFEWKSYIRNKPLFFIIFFALLVFSSYHPFTLGIMIFMLCDIINSVYSIIEPKEIYCSYFKEKNIKDKLNKSLLIINLMTLIPFIICLLLNLNLFHIIILFFLILNMFSISTILNKYANYNIDYTKINTQNMGQIIEIFISIILILPWIFNYFKLKNKSQYKISLYV